MERFTFGPETPLDWEKVGGMMPAIVQDASNGLVLMLGYMNKEALARTVETGSVWFYSRTRQKLWMKGETSGNVLTVKDIRADCDNDTLLVKAEPAGPVCHSGDRTCFREDEPYDALRSLFSVIAARKTELPENSYTTELFKAGINRIALKVAEEALEVVQAGTKQSKERLIEETADLLYHLFVLLVERGATLDDVQMELGKRSQKRNTSDNT
ncbi:MAG: bifunctional phosphoribosyl-AMP cyclohydrolase/phosphoribosyl-ATP diphosphatase HisIE [Patescibacteria group bacterium]|nr:bifunctional phosphoribosyl-AMP cyclohydrolase/phosphoribosyl-ATP diphosphatase HisIE [Patescibacteria group bacterium]